MGYLWTFQNKLFASILSTSIIFFELHFQLFELCHLSINLQSSTVNGKTLTTKKVLKNTKFFNTVKIVKNPMHKCLSSLFICKIAEKNTNEHAQQEKHTYTVSQNQRHPLLQTHLIRFVVHRLQRNIIHCAVLTSLTITLIITSTTCHVSSL